MDEEKKSGEDLFPKIQRSISDFLFDQEGNIPRSKILAVGSMMVLLSVFLAQDAFAKHSSHSSHKSHSSHSSHSSGSHASSHESHVSHQSHTSHSSSTHSSSHSSHSSGTSGDTGTGSGSSLDTGSSSGTTVDPSTYPSSETMPSLAEITPPQVPQPNQVPEGLPDLTSVTPIVLDAGNTPDISS